MNTGRRKLVVIIFARLGPYHVARLEGAKALLGRDSILALEVAAESREYAWDRVSAQGVRRRTVFSGREYEDVPARVRAKAVCATLDEEQPDAVAISGWGFAEGRAAIVWCHRNKKTAIVMSESQERDAPRMWVKELFKQQILELVDAAIVGGERHAMYLERLGFPRERVTIGYDVVDNSHFSAGADEARRSESESDLRRRLGLPGRYFLCSARFVPKKNLLTLIKAYRRYRAEAGEGAWDLVLLGSGPLAAALEAARDAAGFQKCVHMLGFRQYGELPAYYGLASAFVLPSATEQWGLVVNEAMAAALPVLVSKACGSAELVREGVNGFLFEPEDTMELSRLMLRVTCEVDLPSFGAASRGIIAQHSPASFGLALVTALRVGESYRDSRRRRRLPNLALLVP